MRLARGLRRHPGIWGAAPFCASRFRTRPAARGNGESRDCCLREACHKGLPHFFRAAGAARAFQGKLARMIPLHDDNPTRRFPVVTVGIIALCVLAFLWQMSLGERRGEAIVFALGFIPALFFEGVSLPANLAIVPKEATLFTSMFLHGDLLHLGGNMLYLWIFGNNVEDAMGRVRFVVFYLLCGIAAAFAQGLSDPASQIPMIGASGAISGVLGAYLLLHPYAKVLTLLPLGFIITTVQIPAVFVLGFYIVIQFISAALTPMGQEGGVAWWAHIGGFAAGIALIPLFRDRDVPLLAPARRAPTPAPTPWRRGPWG